MPTTRIKPGDLVIERESNRQIFASPGSQKLQEITRYASNRRRGQVQEISEKRNRRGHCILYASVIWEGRNSASLHAINRLALPESDTFETASAGES
jgi:hypothetical protein